MMCCMSGAWNLSPMPWSIGASWVEPPWHQLRGLAEAHHDIDGCARFKGQVGQCICKKAWGEGRSFLEVSVSPACPYIWGGIALAILEANPTVEVHEGRAPRGNAVRQLSDTMGRYETRGW